MVMSLDSCKQQECKRDVAVRDRDFETETSRPRLRDRDFMPGKQVSKPLHLIKTFAATQRLCKCVITYVSHVCWITSDTQYRLDQTRREAACSQAPAAPVL